MNTPNDIFFRCPNCKAKNRIPHHKIGDIGKCGKCGTALDTSELRKPQPMTVTDRNFDSVVLKSPLPVLLECWSPGCPACQTLAPVVDAFAKDLKGKIRVGRINVAQSPVLSSRYDMRSVPVLLLFDGGRLEDQLIGAVPREIILQKILRYL
jgi:thioredoxin 2